MSDEPPLLPPWWLEGVLFPVQTALRPLDLEAGRGAPPGVSSPLKEAYESMVRALTWVAAFTPASAASLSRRQFEESFQESCRAAEEAVARYRAAERLILPVLKADAANAFTEALQIVHATIATSRVFLNPPCKMTPEERLEHYQGGLPAWDWNETARALYRLTARAARAATPPVNATPTAGAALAARGNRRSDRADADALAGDHLGDTAGAAPTDAEREPGFQFWAIGQETGERWHVFRLVKKQWRHVVVLDGLPQKPGSRLLRLLSAFVDKGGCLSLEEVVELESKFSNQLDRAKSLKKILTLVKPEISKLRRLIRKAMKLDPTARHLDPIPYDENAHAWKATVQIGYAYVDDDNRLRFTARDGLSREEELDRRG
jgi:hypothetical protein